MTSALLHYPNTEGRILKVAQLENGYLRIANDLLDALMLAGLSQRQLLVALAIIRKTYGYNKKADDIGLSQIAALTGMAKSHASVAVSDLVRMGILVREQGTHAHNLAVNKDLRQWKKAEPRVTESVTVTKSVTVTESVSEGYQIGNGGVTDSVQNGLPNREPQKTILKTTPKDNTKRQDEPDGFAEFWLAYPKKVSRHDAMRAFAKVKVNLHPTIMRALMAHKASDQWTRDKGQFIPHAATWLNKKRWEDQVQVAAPSGRSGTAAIINKSLGIREADPFTLEMEGPRLGR